MLTGLLRSTFSPCFFFFNDTATTEIYTLSLHDALPILHAHQLRHHAGTRLLAHLRTRSPGDRKSTRLNSSHLVISYAVFCLKKKNTNDFGFFSCYSFHTSGYWSSLVPPRHHLSSAHDQT